MNQLTTNVQMTSLDIAEIVGMKHFHVMRDIRKEIAELGDEVGASIFGLTFYRDKSNRDSACYIFGKDGAMQLALKYDAKTRYKVIKRIEELENKQLQPVQQVPTQSSKQMEATSLLRCLREYSDVLDSVSNRAIQARVVELLIGEAMPNPKPIHVIEVGDKKWYTTKEIAQIAKVSVQKVTWTARKYGVRKNPKYSNFNHNNHPSGFHLPIHYNEAGKRNLLSLLGSVQALI